MSLTATLRPNAFSFNGPNSLGTSRNDPQPFQHEPNYVNLNRMLTRFTHLILLIPSPNAPTEDITPLQQQIQSDLWSPLPFHRTKWLHNIEGARNLLLQLERTAQGIKVQRTRQNVQRDLAEKRTTIKRLRNKVEEIGREVERSKDDTWRLPVEAESSETLYDLLQQQRLVRQPSMADADQPTHESTDVTQVGSQQPLDDMEQEKQSRNELFNGSSTIRRRDKRPSPNDEDSPIATATGVSAHERSLNASAANQEELSSSLLSLAAQLKQQTKAFQFSLDQDKGLFDRALDGLDRNITGMEAASKNMQFLKRMSEGEGWLGRMKLYAIIFGMWIAAILLVFVAPKLRL